MINPLNFLQFFAGLLIVFCCGLDRPDFALIGMGWYLAIGQMKIQYEIRDMRLSQHTKTETYLKKNGL